MKWVVDTCVIIDVLRGDDEFSELSADAIDAKMKDGLWIAPITYVELAPSCATLAHWKCRKFLKRV